MKKEKLEELEELKEEEVDDTLQKRIDNHERYLISFLKRIKILEQNFQRWVEESTK